MKKMQKGFTLIELMIVVAIIAILAAIAIPAYQDYLVRTQVSEGAVLTDGAKTAISEYFSNTGRFPTTAASAGLPATAASISGKYVTGVALPAAGIIQATFGGQASSNISKAGSNAFALSAIDNGGSISWSCKNTTYTTVAAKYLPTSCR